MSINLSKLKEKLPDDFAVVLGEKYHLTPDFIRRVIKGERGNKAVIEGAIALAEKYQSQLKELNQRIEQL